MNTQKLTQKCIEAISRAQGIAREYGNQQLQQAHFLLALIEQEEGIARELIKKCGARPEEMADRLRLIIDRYPKISGDADSLYLSAAADKALREAERLAEEMKDEYVSVEHILLGIVNTADRDIKELLDRSGIDKHGLLSALKDIRGNRRVISDRGYLQRLKKVRLGPRRAGTGAKT